MPPPSLLFGTCFHYFAPVVATGYLTRSEFQRCLYEPASFFENDVERNPMQILTLYEGAYLKDLYQEVFFNLLFPPYISSLNF
jgi:hypothetical protein